MMEESNNSELQKECCGQNSGGCCSKQSGEPRSKLQSYNWLEDIPGGFNDFDLRIPAKDSTKIVRTFLSK